MISLGAKRNMKGILTSFGQGCVIVGAWQTAWATRAAAQYQLFNKGFAGWNWRTKITRGRVLGKCDGVLKRGRMPSEISPQSNLTFSRACLPSAPLHVLPMGVGGGGALPSYQLPTAQSLVRKRDEKKARGAERRRNSRGGGRWIVFFPPLPSFFPPFE